MPIFKRLLQVTVAFSRENQRKLLSTTHPPESGDQEVSIKNVIRGIFLTLSIHYFCNNSSMSFFRLNVHLQFCNQSLILSHDVCTLYTAA